MGLGAVNTCMVLLCYTYLLLCLTPVYGADIQVRLTNGRDRFEGLLEVQKASSRWGTVCDDSFDSKDATVVCRQLQMGRGIPKYSEISGTGPISLDDLECTGEETNLGQCSSKAWGSHNCQHSEDVFVSCLQDIQARLTGGSHEYEGLLEVRLDDDYPWGTVCNDHFGEVEASVVCKMLRFRQGRVVPTAAGQMANSSMFLDDLACSGNETNIVQCRTKDWGSHDCSQSQAVSVSCFQEIQVSLTGGYGDYEGLLEVRKQEGDSWGTVCSQNFTDVEASAVCKQLNFKRGQAFTGPAGAQNMSLGEVDCRGSESVLGQCRSKPWNEVYCPSSQQVSIICEPMQAPKEACIHAHIGGEIRYVCYQFMHDVITGDDDMLCSMFNAHPVTIDSPEHMENLLRILRTHRPGQMWWIGLKQNNSLWKWRNGRTLASYSPLWAEGEPLNECGYIAEDKSGISTLPCDKRANYICESLPLSFNVDNPASGVADPFVDEESAADKDNSAGAENIPDEENHIAIEMNNTVKENDNKSSVTILLSVAVVELLIIVALLIVLGFTTERLYSEVRSGAAHVARFTISLWKKAKASANKGPGRTTDWNSMASEPILESDAV